MVDQDVDDLVEVLKVLDVDLAQTPFGKIMKPDLEALVNVTAEWSTRVHVRLHGHQEHGIEALGLTVGGVGLDVGKCRAEWHRPGRVENEECR